MLISDNPIQFQLKGQAYTVRPGDIFQDNGHGIIFLPKHRVFKGGGNPLAKDVPNEEWPRLIQHLKPVSWKELDTVKPLIDVKYYELK